MGEVGENPRFAAGGLDRVELLLAIHLPEERHRGRIGGDLRSGGTRAEEGLEARVAEAVDAGQHPVGVPVHGGHRDHHEVVRAARGTEPMEGEQDVDGQALRHPGRLHGDLAAGRARSRGDLARVLARRQTPERPWGRAEPDLWYEARLVSAPPTQNTFFHRLLIANRGEVAARVARTCLRLGVTPVFAVSEADRDAAYCADHERVVIGPGRSAQSYLDPERLVQAAKQSGCTALHPGWGFLAESPRFAALAQAHGVTFLGPPAAAMLLMGKKTPAKRAMGRAGLTLIPGSEGILADVDDAKRVAAEVGYPVLLKAESGGGGRGMRIARDADSIEQAYREASGEALAAFGDDRLYLEKLVERGRHVEIQLLADKYGNVVHLGLRDCTVQRNHQKLVEESPAPLLADDERARTLEAAIEATRAIGYVGAGTMELLQDRDGTLRFMEMNTRLQVEHTVSEMRARAHGEPIDLVEQQIRVGAGQRLAFTQDDITLEGHAIECRINAEDPSADFRPAPGRIERLALPTGEGVRVDTHVAEGYVVPPFYDSLLCKVITHGKDRAEAVDRMIAARSSTRRCDPSARSIRYSARQRSALPSIASQKEGITSRRSSGRMVLCHTPPE